VECHEPKKIVEKIKEDIILKNIKVDTTDGVKIWYEDGWVLIRPSGTEPIIRIFAESRTKERAMELMNEGVQVVKNYG
jgi:phosphomannomutase/phosphoglucomutase